MTSLSAYEVTDSTTSCFWGMYACPATDGDFVAIFLTVNFPLITPGTPNRGLYWPSSTVAAITPNRLYLIAKKDILASP
jgi:hypothetical protein